MAGEEWATPHPCGAPWAGVQTLRACIMSTTAGFRLAQNIHATI